MRYFNALVLLALLLPCTPAASIYNNSGTFFGAVGTTLTDGYGVADGYPAGFGSYDNATMSAFFGETLYQTTGHNNNNLIPSEYYCAGCNGSFLLDFTATSLGTANGVYGMGLDIRGNAAQLPYYAFVTFGDNSTLDLALPDGASYFGITDALLIKSIHFGLSGGGTTTSGSFSIDNLTIASGGAQIPEPASFILLGSALAGLALLRRHR
jgi:hypothetical protein